MVAEVIQNVKVDLQQYWVLRGIEVKDNDRKVVVAEDEMLTIPSKDDIAQFLILNPKADFCSIEVNYRIVGFIKE